MKISYPAILCLLFLFTFCQKVNAQEWATAYQESVDLYNNYQSPEAKLAAERAIRSYKSQIENPDKNLAAIYRQLSIICYDLNLLDEALIHAKAEVELLQKLNLLYDISFVSASQNLALIRIARSEYEAAEPLLKASLLLSADFYTLDSYEYNSIKGLLASTIFNLKKDNEAEPLFVESLTAMNQLEEVGSEFYTTVYDYGSLLTIKGQYQEALSQYKVLEDYYNYDTPNFEYSSILIKVGDLLDKLKRYQEAVSKYELALEGFEALNENGSKEYEIALNNLAIEYQKVNAFDKSEDLLIKLTDALAADSTLAPMPYASALTNYANLLLRKGLLSESKEKLETSAGLYTNGNLEKDLLYAQTLESLAQINYTQGNFEEAFEQIEEALTAITDSTKTYSFLEKKARILARQGQYAASKIIVEQAVEESILFNGENSLATGYVKNALAQISTDLGDYSRAEMLYKEIIPQFEQWLSPNHPEFATISANYSSLLQLMGNYYTAETWLKSAIKIKLEAYGKDNPDYLTSYENLGLLYQNTARYTEASGVFQEILEIKENSPLEDEVALAYTYLNLGNVKKQLADYAEAENLLKKAKTIYENSIGEKHVYYASLLNSLALLYQKMGNIEAAKPLLEQSLAVYEELLGKQNPEYATSLENLATLYQMEGNREKAKELLEEVLVIDKSVLGTDHPLYSKTLHNLASLYEENDEFEQAKELYNQALSIAENKFGKMHPSYASTLYNLAVLEQELENYGQAKMNYMQVVDIRRELLGEYHPDYTYASYGLASIYHKTNELESAKALYFEVIEKYSDDNAKYFPALSETEKSAFWGKIRPVFEAFMDYAVEFVLLNKGTTEDRSNMIAALYNLQLSTKALLLNATNKVRNNILSSGDEQLIADFNTWLALKENIVKAYGMSKEEAKSTAIDIKGMETQANDMEKALSLQSSAFSGAFDNVPINWTDIKNTLGPDEAALEIIRIKKKVKSDSVIYVSLIIDNQTSEAPKMVVNAKGVYMEAKGFKSYKNSIIYKVKDSKSFPLYWQDIDAAMSESVNKLYLSADGVYNKINISTLFDNNKQSYVIDSYSIRLLSNTKEIVTTIPAEGEASVALLYGFPKYDLGSRGMKRSSLFNKEDSRSAFGDKIAPLPGTNEEVSNIEKELGAKGWKYEKYITDNATETQIKTLKSPTVLHIATHGFFLPDIQVDEDQQLTSRNAKYNPLLRSGLLLAGAENTINNQEIPGEEDGILTAYEAMNLSLDNTQLVVMSACETGLGEVKNGEGVYGLQRAFIVAGADNLIMSLWKVNDETTQKLMSGFYSNWLSGESKLIAFNHAISDLKSEFEQPYYWGAFVILGM
ncbi:MAG: CHAT domain-containing tetratricopeptide repeat protein [Cyclobacteriaceae bacterium]